MTSRYLAACALFFLFGCGTPDSTITVELAPEGSLPPFGPVEEAMGASCASLDCHGQSGRNLRLFDSRGLRLSSKTNSGEGVTSKAEIDADYLSVAGLEPTLFSHVVKEGGAMPDRLTIVRKARGAEDHKGGTLWPEGSNGDRCFTTWLKAATDEDACMKTVTDFSTPEQ